jgi:hypothetical protein
MHVHDIADHQRRALVAAQHAGGHGPRHLHLTDVARIDLLEFAVAMIGIVAGLDRPVRRLAHDLLEIVRRRRAARPCGNRGRNCNGQNGALMKFHGQSP